MYYLDSYLNQDMLDFQAVVYEAQISISEQGYPRKDSIALVGRLQSVTLSQRDSKRAAPSAATMKLKEWSSHSSKRRPSKVSVVKLSHGSRFGMFVKYFYNFEQIFGRHDQSTTLKDLLLSEMVFLYHPSSPKPWSQQKVERGYPVF